MGSSIVFNTGRRITGQGSDEVGDFVMEGRYDDRKVKFMKKYTTGSQVGATPLTYEGKFQECTDGQKITGKYYWHDPDDGDAFEMVRSKELEKKREAAFKSVVSTMKRDVGAMRLLAEDLEMFGCKLAYLLYYTDAGSVQKIFTVISLLTNLMMAVAGPMLEHYLRHTMAKAAEGLPLPEILQSKSPSKGVGSGALSESHEGYAKLDDELADQEGYEARLAEAEKVTLTEVFTGNLDYIAVLMEKTHRPAEVIDVAITDLIAMTPHLRGTLVLSSLLFWSYAVSLPLLFSIPCGHAPPSMAHLAYFVTAFFNVFIQIWCSSLTKFGYLMLAHAPQMFAFDCGLSLLGLFSSYSSCLWIMMLRECGIWLWKPAAFFWFLGTIILQAIPGIYLLWTNTQVPMALRLSQNNLLVALLKPAP